MNENKLIEDFKDFTKGKRQNATITKLVIIVCGLIVVCCLFFNFKVSSTAASKVKVITKSGAYLETELTDEKALFNSLINNACAMSAYYINSFNRYTIKFNQTKAVFLCNRNDVYRVVAYYENNKGYGDALDRGVDYSCEYQGLDQLSGDYPPYSVQFHSILTVNDNGNVSKYLIKSEGKLIKTHPQYPENVGGWYFTNYQQSVYPYTPTK